MHSATSATQQCRVNLRATPFQMIELHKLTTVPIFNSVSPQVSNMYSRWYRHIGKTTVIAVFSLFMLAQGTNDMLPKRRSRTHHRTPQWRSGFFLQIIDCLPSLPFMVKQNTARPTDKNTDYFVYSCTSTDMFRRCTFDNIFLILSVCPAPLSGQRRAAHAEITCIWCLMATKCCTGKSGRRKKRARDAKKGLSAERTAAMQKQKATARPCCAVVTVSAS